MNDSTIDDGGPAFPQQGFTYPNGETEYPMPGMTLRDWFAGQALNGLYSSGDIDLTKHTTEKSVGRSNIAKLAYAVADAMIEARKLKTL
jgi:hypothetical protein